MALTIRGQFVRTDIQNDFGLNIANRGRTAAKSCLNRLTPLCLYSKQSERVRAKPV